MLSDEGAKGDNEGCFILVADAARTGGEDAGDFKDGLRLWAMPKVPVEQAVETVDDVHERGVP